MPEAPHKPDSLEAQAAALVNSSSDGIDLDALAAEALDSVADSTPATSNDAAVQNADNLDQAVEQLISDAAASTPIPATQSVKPETNGAASAAFTPPLDPAVTTGTATSEPITNLDSRIAEQADDMIAGEFADEQNEVKGQIGAPPPPPRPEPSALPPRSTPAPESPPEPISVVPDIPLAPRPVAPAPAKAASRPPARPKSESKQRSSPPKLLAALAAPLSRRSKQTRDLVGWAAIITVLNATCLWGYLVFFRSATPAVAKAPASSHAAMDDGHGKDEQAKPASKTKEKKTTPKKSSNKDAQASHGGH